MYGGYRIQLRGSNNGGVEWHDFFIRPDNLLFMKTKKEIFRDLLISAETNCVLKIKLRGVANPVITAVDKISPKKILLKPTCLYGYALNKREIILAEVESVTRYKTHFNHPIFEKIRFIKNNLSEIRKNIESFQTPSGFLKAGS